MYQQRFARNARRNRLKAIVTTIALNAFLLAGLAYNGSLDLHSLLPETVKEWFGMEEPVAEPIEEVAGVRP